MKILLIGGTGTISGAIAKLLAQRGDDLILLNRGNRTEAVPEGAKVVCCDVNDEAQVAEKLAGECFDAVCQFVGYKSEHVRRDYRLFAGKTKQYIFTPRNISTSKTSPTPRTPHFCTTSIRRSTHAAVCSVMSTTL